MKDEREPKNGGIKKDTEISGLQAVRAYFIIIYKSCM